MKSSKVGVTAVSPQFVVEDLVRTAEHYRDILGFEIRGYFLDPPAHAIVGRGRAEIFLAKASGRSGISNRELKAGAIDAYFHVEGLDALFEELKDRDAGIIEGPVIRVYGTREIVVHDCDGFVLVFGEDAG